MKEKRRVPTCPHPGNLEMDTVVPKMGTIVRINHACRVGYIRFAGTHAQYDEIDAEEI
jgi:mRNA-degrading endonuclease HigB of HigAB toxin-antitoxin module